jgi:hypothetical protein
MERLATRPPRRTARRLVSETLRPAPADRVDTEDRKAEALVDPKAARAEVDSAKAEAGEDLARAEAVVDLARAEAVVDLAKAEAGEDSAKADLAVDMEDRREDKEVLPLGVAADSEAVEATVLQADELVPARRRFWGQLRAARTPRGSCG